MNFLPLPDPERGNWLPPAEFIATLSRATAYDSPYITDQHGHPVLLNSSAYKPDKGRIWQFPGGQMDPGETPREAAVRETQQETGLTSKCGRLLAVHFLPPEPTRPANKFGLLRRALSGKEPAPVITLGLDDGGRYVIEVKSPKATMQLAFDTARRSGAPFATLALEDPIRLVTADGTDHTKEIDGKLDKALSRLAPADNPAGEGPEGTGGASQTARAGGPQSRKGTVLRL